MSLEVVEETLLILPENLFDLCLELVDAVPICVFLSFFLSVFLPVVICVALSVVIWFSLCRFISSHFSHLTSLISSLCLSSCVVLPLSHRFPRRRHAVPRNGLGFLINVFIEQ